MSDKDLIDAKELAPSEVVEVDLYQRREKIYTRHIEGFFQRIRLLTGWPLLIGYFLLPWLSWDDRPMVLFDLPERKFHILGLTFWPQDFSLLAFLLIIAAFALFVVTAFAGRIWCGYTCPQTVWTSIFMWIEQRCEGSRNQRIKLDQAPWGIEKALRKGLKHGGWVIVAFATGATFIGYFYPIRDLLWEFLTLNSGKWQILWTLFFTCATYINAGWMREQVCTYMCPYARFQSVMFDQDTLIVSYDPARGEPRGSRKHGADPKAVGMGDCIDCEICVQVCPTGIDIRDGLQYECIGCALCIDACNSVMDKMDYPRGLIRYTSERALAGGKTQWLRPRVIGYTLILLIMFGLLSWRIMVRTPLEMTVIRDRTELYVTRQDGSVENIYTLSVANMDEVPHEFKVILEGLPGASLIGETRHTLEDGEVRRITLRVREPAGNANKPTTVIEFRLRSTDQRGLEISSESRFMRPQP